MTTTDYSVTLDGVTITLRGAPVRYVDGRPTFSVTDVHEANRLAALGLIRSGSHGAEAFKRTLYALRIGRSEAEELGIPAEWLSGKVGAPFEGSPFVVFAAMLREEMRDPMTVREHIAAMKAHQVPAAITLDWPNAPSESPAASATA